MIKLYRKKKGRGRGEEKVWEKKCSLLMGFEKQTIFFK